jgi:hypothetical protein
MFDKNLIIIGNMVLITTDNWFYAPDGRQYRAVFGTIRGVKDAEKILGIITNNRSTNWYIEIGNMTIAGCQIHYVIKTDKCNFDGVEEWERLEGETLIYKRPSSIYNADE